MDIKKLEEMREPSAMKMAVEAKARLDSLHLATGSIDSLLKIAHDLDSIKKLSTHTATHDLLSNLSKAFPSSNLVLDNETTKIMKELAGSSLLNYPVFESLEINKSFIDSIEALNIHLKPKTQFIMPEGISSGGQLGDLSSVMSKASEAFKQYEQLSGLASFKALSKLKNFPFEDIVPTDDTDIKDNIFKMDSEISDELALVNDFNELSEEKRNILLDLYQAYYYPILSNCMMLLILLKVFLDEKMDLANKTFIFVKSTEKPISYVRKQIDFASLKNNLLACAIYDILKHLFLS